MGLRGAATSRAEAQVLRLSAIYAALDSSSIIGLPHLQAAFAVWDYCSASASFLFGTSTGVPIADRIREALDSSPNGLSKNQISRLFHGHVNTDRIDAALEQLLALDAVNCHSEPTAGRPSTLWSAISQHEEEEEEAGAPRPLQFLAGTPNAYLAPTTYAGKSASHQVTVFRRGIVAANLRAGCPANARSPKTRISSEQVGKPEPAFRVSPSRHCYQW